MNQSVYLMLFGAGLVLLILVLLDVLPNPISAAFTAVVWLPVIPASWNVTQTTRCCITRQAYPALGFLAIGAFALAVLYLFADATGRLPGSDPVVGRGVR